MIFANATTAPTLAANIATAVDSADYLLVMECSASIGCPGGAACLNGVCQP